MPKDLENKHMGIILPGPCNNFRKIYCRDLQNALPHGSELFMVRNETENILHKFLPLKTNCFALTEVYDICNEVKKKFTKN